MTAYVDDPVVATGRNEPAIPKIPPSIPPLLIPRLKTTPHLFAAWLEDRSRHPARVRLHRGGRGEDRGLLYTRQPGRSMPSPSARKIILSLTGTVVREGTVPSLEGVRPFGSVHHLPNVVRLDLIQLNADTCELAAECLDPLFSEAFRDLLRDMAERWTETAERIDAYLGSATGTKLGSRLASSAREPRVPGRIPDFKRWQKIWTVIRSQVEGGTHYEDIAVWLRRMHPELKASAELIADIAKAGVGGLLDHSPQ